jgi:hypothetical protein
MSVSLLQVMAAASARVAPLTGECAGYVVMTVADQLTGGPRLIGAGDVRIEDNGVVRIVSGPASDEVTCEQALRALLDSLLMLARSSGVSLLRVGRRAARGEVAQLIQELEVALIPANRAAARRSLARLHRETTRALEAGAVPLTPEISQPRAAEVPVLRSEAPAECPPPAAPPAAGELSVDIEFTPEPEPVSAGEPEPMVQASASDFQPETPTEPIVRRRVSGIPIAPVEVPDIHKTPYLGTMVAPIVASPVAALPIAMAEDAPADSEPAPREETTDRMPPVVEWLDSGDLEEDDDFQFAQLAVPTALPAQPIEPAPPRFEPRQSDVQELLRSFSVADAEPTRHVMRGLTELAGLSRTPPPVAAHAGMSQEAGTRDTQYAACREHSASGADEDAIVLTPMRTIPLSGS